MSKKINQLILIFGICLLSSNAWAKVDLDMLLEFRPLSVLETSDLEGLKLDEGNLNYSPEVVSAGISIAPSLKIGMGIGTSILNIDLTGGFGQLWNSTFHSNMYIGDVAFRFKLKGNNNTLGPHVSVIKFDPEWDELHDEQEQVTLGETTAIAPGLSLTAGSKIISFLLSIDYISGAKFDLETQGRWVANKDSIDLSGINLNLGIICRFF